MGAWRAASSPGQGWLLLRPRPRGSASLGQDPKVDPRTPGTAGAHDFLTGHAHEVLGASAARMSHGARPPPCHQGSPSCQQLTLPAGSQGGQPCARPSDTCPGAPSSRQQAGCTPGPPAGVCTGWWSVDLGVSFPSGDTGGPVLPRTGWRPRAAHRARTLGPEGPAPCEASPGPSRRVAGGRQPAGSLPASPGWQGGLRPGDGGPCAGGAQEGTARPSRASGGAGAETPGGYPAPHPPAQELPGSAAPTLAPTLARLQLINIHLKPKASLMSSCVAHPGLICALPRGGCDRTEVPDANRRLGRRRPRPGSPLGSGSLSPPLTLGRWAGRTWGEQERGPPPSRLSGGSWPLRVARRAELTGPWRPRLPLEPGPLACDTSRSPLFPPRSRLGLGDVGEDPGVSPRRCSHPSSQHSFAKNPLW